jgi:hypothetical protein
MLGYDYETKRGMKVINIKNYKVIVKDVTFREDITIEGMLRTNVFYDPYDAEEVELSDVKEDSEDDLEEKDDDSVPGLIYDEEDDLYRCPVESRWRGL